MALIGNLLVKLGLNSAVFDRNIKKSHKHVTGFEKGIKGVGRTLARLAGPLAAAFGVYKLAQYGSRTMVAIDRTAKLSEQIGISVEALSSYGLAAELSGTSVEAVGKSLQIFSRRMGEAKMGTGEALRGLEKMNMTAEQLTKIPVDQALELIADRLYGMADAEDRALTLYALFGRAGQELLVMLQGGSDALRAMRKEMRDFGGVFNRFGALQVTRANDAITRLKFAIGGLMTQLTIRLAPVIERVVMFAVDLMKKIDVNTLFERMMRAVDKFVEWVLAALQRLTVMISITIGGMATSKMGKFMGIAGQLEDVADGFLQLSISLMKATFKWRGFRREFEAFEKGLQDKFRGTPYGDGGYTDYLKELLRLQGLLTGPTPAMAGGPRFAREIESERFNLRALQLGGGDTIPQQQLEEQRKIRAAIKSLETALENSVGFPE